VRFGADELRDTPSAWAAWRRVGLVTNDAARLAAEPTCRSRWALQQDGLPIVRLFGPEHGLGAAAADGASVQDGYDALTGLPVVSLYGERMRPSAEHLADLDAVLFDIPDVGARFYTYAWTLWHVLQACAEARIPLVVLDRPNPLGGVIDSAEGPMLEPDCRSFIGESDIPIRHSVTYGELARLWQRERAPSLSLEVIPCRGWDRSRAWSATGCVWIPTSPAMPHAECAIWYPGTCLFEATNISVARGTDAPFATIGAPWLDVERLKQAVQVDGVALHPESFTPALGPHAGELCSGIRLELTAPDPAAFIAQQLRPVALGLQLLAQIARRHPQAFAWATYPTAANPSGADHFARLVGTRVLAASLVDPLALRPTETATRATEWAARVAPILLY
jgi:uncharacterized protein YbbC (DUF1343 family)